MYGIGTTLVTDDETKESNILGEWLLVGSNLAKDTETKKKNRSKHVISITLTKQHN